MSLYKYLIIDSEGNAHVTWGGYDPDPPFRRIKNLLDQQEGEISVMKVTREEFTKLSLEEMMVEYSDFVNTLESTAECPTEIRLFHSICGIQDEIGELTGNFKRETFGKEPYGEIKRPEKVNLLEELGDSLFYHILALNALAQEQDQTLVDMFRTIIEVNVTKLAARYPTGKFRTEDSEKRDIEAEREEMEKVIDGEK